MLYPIGIQNFEKLRDGDYIYFDKTDKLYNLVNQGGYYFLSRPRRFGKSLLVSTLEAYLQGNLDVTLDQHLRKIEAGYGIQTFTDTSEKVPKNLLRPMA